MKCVNRNKNLSALFQRTNDHDNCFVYEVQTQIFNYLKTYHSIITKINYFSDGCAAQNKNQKNFVKTIPGTKCFHQFTPISNDTISNI